MTPTLYNGDCLDVMRDHISDSSIDSIICDPPYGLKFMSKKWDYDLPSVKIWKQCLRVLKPGGTILAFGGSRTFHRLACRIEDAGFEIRDCISWIYGSGFPKSHNIAEALGDAPEAALWRGHGTALKPAWEPILVAQKPPDGTYAANALAHGVAGLHIDGARIGSETRTNQYAGNNGKFCGEEKGCGYNGDGATTVTGRWPANLILDESAAQILDSQSGVSHSKKRKTGTVNKGGMPPIGTFKIRDRSGEEQPSYEDSGGASRFFYIAKPSAKERNAGVALNNHPTLKPLALMQHLCKLTATPTGGIVLDPFMGSGSTGCAAALVGRPFVGIELDAAYYKIAQARIDFWSGREKKKTIKPVFTFDEDEDAA